MYSYPWPANEYNLKKFLKGELDVWAEGSLISILHGIHGLEDGLLGTVDQGLVTSFNSGVRVIKEDKRCSEIIQKKNLTLEEMIIKTEKNEKGRMELLDKEKIIEKCRKSNIIVLCFCYTTVNEINSFLRASGLYTGLYMNKDISDIHGRLLKFDLKQKAFIETFINNKPQNVLLAGHFGCGKTVLGSQFLAIRISELEMKEDKSPYRVIVAADVPHADTKLL